HPLPTLPCMRHIATQGRMADPSPHSVRHFMSRLARTLAFIARFAVIGLAAAFVIGLLWPGASGLLRQHLGLGTPAPATSTTADAHGNPDASVAAGPASYAAAVNQAAPSVVNIYANKLVTEHPT